MHDEAKANYEMWVKKKEEADAKLEAAKKEEDETKAAVIEAEAKKAELERQVAEAKEKGTDADRAAAAELAEEQRLVDEAEAKLKALQEKERKGKEALAELKKLIEYVKEVETDIRKANEAEAKVKGLEAEVNKTEEELFQLDQKIDDLTRQETNWKEKIARQKEQGELKRQAAEASLKAAKEELAAVKARNAASDAKKAEEETGETAGAQDAEGGRGARARDRGVGQELRQPPRPGGEVPRAARGRDGWRRMSECPRASIPKTPSGRRGLYQHDQLDQLRPHQELRDREGETVAAAVGRPAGRRTPSLRCRERGRARPRCIACDNTLEKNHADSAVLGAITSRACRSWRAWLRSSDRSAVWDSMMPLGSRSSPPRT